MINDTPTTHVVESNAYEFRILDFIVYNDPLNDDSSSSESDDDVGKRRAANWTYKKRKDKNEFSVKIIGLDEYRKLFSLLVTQFRPFFYVMVDNDWTEHTKRDFMIHLNHILSKSSSIDYSNSIVSCNLIKKRKLYGFDNGALYSFIHLEFANMQVYNKVRNLWFTKTPDELVEENGYQYLNPNGLYFKGKSTKLYDTIPPILRFIHLSQMSPSGWISVQKNHATICESSTMYVDYELITTFSFIHPIPEKEQMVPYKIMSFDIEASSSHGDFPLPVKDYKKVASEIIDCLKTTQCSLRKLLRPAIIHSLPVGQISRVYLKHPIETDAEFDVLFNILITTTIDKKTVYTNTINSYFASVIESDNESDNDNDNESDDDNDYDEEKEEEDEEENDDANMELEHGQVDTICQFIRSTKHTRNEKIAELTKMLNSVFPPIEGDKVTFIGSTVMSYGNSEPHLNHCIVLNSCDPLDNVVIETYDTEREVLCAWKDFVQRENPDVIIGYNIFRFDYEFMFRRSLETNCMHEFLQLSRTTDQVCANRDSNTGKWNIETSNVKVASGEYNLHYIKMDGRIQIDLYNHYRKTEILSSYKLDSVAGEFISDYITKVEYDEEHNTTTLFTKNTTGLYKDSYIHVQEHSHSIEYANGGKKYKVDDVIIISSNLKQLVFYQIIPIDTTKTNKWCLAKDDVSVKDIFELSRGTSADRKIIAKYCIQDCNLVHYLFNKSDILTGFIEMSKVCWVPIPYLVFRGQGIKLTSVISKACMEQNILIPTLEKCMDKSGYEGAIVFDTTGEVLLEDPVVTLDYAGLYPSEMRANCLSHDTKVWCKEYDLNMNLLSSEGEKDEVTGEFKYDNLEGIEYITHIYDTFKYVRPSPKKKEVKVKTGFRECRFAQIETAVIPSILTNIMNARAATRKLIKTEKDAFMRNVLDKRQLAFKVTANSTYGQCGAKTSTFYEKDVAACTTAGGRKMVTYAKRIVEECYYDKVCDTSHGQVRTFAKCIYGDTDSVFIHFHLHDMDGNKIVGKKALAISMEIGQEAGRLASNYLKFPHDLEYEKVFCPFILFTKKRYYGILYEHDIYAGYCKVMGLELKRRDNASIVKDIFGGILHSVVATLSIENAIEFLRTCLQDMLDQKYHIDKLIISKSLRSGYAYPDRIVHKVLADRIAERDPGNKPAPGDRIPYVFIYNAKKNKKNIKQHERVEDPTYVQDNNLKIDYVYYITNQIMKPVQQFFALVLEDVLRITGNQNKIPMYRKQIATIRRLEPDDKKRIAKIKKLQNEEVKKVLFDKYLNEAEKKATGQKSITSFFTGGCDPRKPPAPNGGAK